MSGNINEKSIKNIKSLGLELILLSILILCTIFILFVMLSLNTEATDVEGYISSDTNWNTSGSPYIVKDDLYVNESVTLTIEPGVIIRFDGDHYFYVNGNLSAQGNATEKIIFTSDNFNPSRGDWQSIYIRDEGYAYLEYCEISYAFYGIRLESSNSSILNTNITECDYGIYLSYSQNTTLTNINISDCEDGIYFYRTEKTAISNCQFWNISDDPFFLLYGYSSDMNYYDHTVTDSEVNGKPFFYYFDAHDIAIEDLQVGMIIVAFGDNFTISNCNVTNGGGIHLYHVSNTTITDSYISENYKGIYLDHSPIGDTNVVMFNTIIHCTFSHNKYGIRLHSSDDNVITNNSIDWNEFGVYLYYSNYNWIFHNSFNANDDQVYETGYSSGRHNNFDNGREGNYWSDYSGRDASGDGIGDTSYWVSSNSRDYYPLMHPWNGSLPPDTVLPFFSSNPSIFGRSITTPEEEIQIRFDASELGHYEIVINTDGIDGFDNTTDIVLFGNTTTFLQDVFWNGWDNDKDDFVDDGAYQIQIMIWDRAGNSLAETRNLGTVSIIKDTDSDGIRDSEDAFPENPMEWEDFDNDGIGDNSDSDLDNDGVQNGEDVFPMDSSEWSDKDHDGIGDNADPDDNNNDIADVAEIPLAIAILLIPCMVLYFVNRQILRKKEEEELEKEEGKKVQQPILSYILSSLRSLCRTIFTNSSCSP